MSVQAPGAPATGALAGAARGLEDVVAGVSAVCDVRGTEGRLIYRGYDIHDLARHSTFEETAYLLWNGDLPARDQLDDLRTEIGQARDLPGPVWGLLGALPPHASVVDGLLTGICVLSLHNPEAGQTSAEVNQRQAIRLTARVPVLAANLARLKEGKEFVHPRADLSTAANFLYTYFGREADDAVARALDTVFVLHADHEFNASTFAGRIAASTLADMHAALTAAIAVLQGPLHGGASEQVMAMLEEIGEPERAEQWVMDKLAQRKKIMGFGHRVYKTEDPRATHLREMSRELGERAGDRRWFDISHRIEEVVMREKGLHSNVDFYSASVYRAMGLPVFLNTALFACSRVAGYTAHFIEQYADNRLIRPRSLYMGFADRSYVPMSMR